MSSRRTPKPLTMVALIALGAAGASAFAYGCGSNNSTSASNGADAAVETGPTPPAGNLQCSAESTDWPMFGQNVCNTNSQATSGGISKDTVGTLTKKWEYAAKGDVSATPTVVGGSVYFPDWAGYINKLDAATGTETWSKSISGLLASAPGGVNRANLQSRNAPLVTGGMVIFGTLRGLDLGFSPGTSAYMMAIDQNTAAVKWATLVDPNPLAIIAGSPVLDGGTLYVGVSSMEEYAGTLAAVLAPGQKYTCCTFRGSVVALDVATGHMKWQTPMITDALFYANDAGKLSGFAGNAIWSSTPVVDRKRKQLYVTTGNNYHYSGPGEADAGADKGNFVDAVVAVDMDSGAVKWARSFPKGGEDLWTLSSMGGPDSDFGAGANLFSATIHGVLKDVVGAGQKSGMYWALDPDTGETLWATQIAPGGHLGGIHWGTATDGTRIYVENNFESTNMPFALGGMGAHAGETAATGTWAALDPSNGNILWQIKNPALPNGPYSNASSNGPVAVVNGVLFAGSMDMTGTMFAFNAATGDVLWSYTAGGTVYGGPAIVDGVVYWGAGYPSSVRPLGFGTSIKKVFAFGLGLGATDGGLGDAAPPDAAPDAALGAAPDAAPEAASDAALDAAPDAAGD